MINSSFFAILAALVVCAQPSARPANLDFQHDLANFKDDPRNESSRRKVIQDALGLIPAPSAPPEAYELKGWADATLKHARETADYEEAAAAYEKALALAPWSAADYLGLADAQEKLGRYQEAAANLDFYLLSAPAAKDAGQTRRRIADLSSKLETGRGPRLAEVLDRLKGPRTGALPWTYECGRYGPLETLRKRVRMECDEKECADGLHWHKMEMLATHELQPREGGGLQLWSVRGSKKILELDGRPKGAYLSEITWLRCGRTGTCDKPVWVELSEDLTQITISADRPAGTSSDPKARFAYLSYRRK